MVRDWIKIGKSWHHHDVRSSEVTSRNGHFDSKTIYQMVVWDVDRFYVPVLLIEIIWGRFLWDCRLRIWALWSADQIVVYFCCLFELDQRWRLNLPPKCHHVQMSRTWHLSIKSPTFFIKFPSYTLSQIWSLTQSVRLGRFAEITCYFTMPLTM